jgi:hypothetical protein
MPSTVKEHFLHVPGFIDIGSVHLQLAEICARCIDGIRTGFSDAISLTSSEEKIESMNRDEDLLAFEYGMEKCNVDFRAYAIEYRLAHIREGLGPMEFAFDRARLRRNKIVV